ncbi:hypothetical protein FEDK69T_22980 [Flavobacterium enshiense DK69]|nr:hypothetical protein [Flavobacterium enshiense]ESU22315.1 hypothetical protein FEDK69T_22980 [Flavobacterium enshiense DK69]
MQNNVLNNRPVRNINGAANNRTDINRSVGLNANNESGDVVIIQRLLRLCAYPVTVNGVIRNGETDPTVSSILNFQANNSLRITGQISPNDETFVFLKNHVDNLPSFSEADDESIHQPFITNAFFFRRNANNPNTLNVIFEGDSWLDYPIPRVLDLYDTISDRNQRLNLNSLHLAKFGETTTDMYRDRSHFVQYVTNYRIDRIYFSGGGNDVFPQLGNIVKSGLSTFRNNYFTDASKLNDLRNMPVGDDLYRKCIQYKNYLNTLVFDNDAFNGVFLNSIFSTIANNYIRFGSIVNLHCSSNLKFYMHSYDYPLYKLGVRPSIGPVNLPLGPWINPVFTYYGITDAILKSYIIIRLIDKFYALLHYIKHTFQTNNFGFQTQIVDLRGVLNSSNYWRDEIHPNSIGATRLATRVNF